MTSKYAGENTIQAVINETKKLTRPEVAIGNTIPVDENVQLFVKEDEEGTSPNDFYTKAEVDKIKNDLLTAINGIYGLRLLAKGEVEDPADHPNSSGGFDAQSVTISTSGWGNGILFVDCKMEYNPETASFVGTCIGNYIHSSLLHLAGSTSNGYIEVVASDPSTVEITVRSQGCGKLYYNIWMIPFIKPV